MPEGQPPGPSPPVPNSGSPQHPSPNVKPLTEGKKARTSPLSQVRPAAVKRLAPIFDKPAQKKQKAEKAAGAAGLPGADKVTAAQGAKAAAPSKGAAPAANKATAAKGAGAAGTGKGAGAVGSSKRSAGKGEAGSKGGAGVKGAAAGIGKGEPEKKAKGAAAVPPQRNTAASQLEMPNQSDFGDLSDYIAALMAYNKAALERKKAADATVTKEAAVKKPRAEKPADAMYHKKVPRFQTK